MTRFLHNFPRSFSTILAISACLAASTSIANSNGLPQNLPSGLPEGLILSPFDADRVWVERWGSNDDWSNSGIWLTGQQVGEQVDVNFDNSVLINNRSIYREDDYTGTGLALQEITPKPGFPNEAGMTVWIGTAEPEATSGNDNVDVGDTFTIGSLTVQNVSAGVGRSFRNGGVLVFDSGSAGSPARIIHLGDENSEGEDMNIREGTSFQLNSPTELYLLNTSSRFRIRNTSQITGTGDLILNPGDAQSYTGTATGQGPEIQRELRIENTGRISTSGEIHIGAARIRIADDGDITNTSAIHIHPQGQLRLDRTGTVNYDLGDGPIILNSEGHRMDDESNGAIRQQANSINDTAVVSNPIQLTGDSRVHSRDQGTLVLEGNISGEGELRKTGEGPLHLSGSISNNGGLDITNGHTEIIGADRLQNVPLRFGSRENQRHLRLNGNQSVSLLDGDDIDPDEADASSTLTLELGDSAVLTVNQEFDIVDGDEITTRFQGVIAGSGSLTKTGHGTLRLTRWAKSYTGPTLIEQGVLEVSESAALAATESITVNDEGQLRLSTSGSDVHYSFGGPLVLNGNGRNEVIGTGQDLGVLGSLRYQPGSGAHQATVSSPVELASDTRIHVNGSQKTLRLTGLISGNGGFTKSGGGDLILQGDHSYAGHTLVENGHLQINGNLSGNGSVIVQATNRLSGTGSIAGDLELSGILDVPSSGNSFTVGGSIYADSTSRIVINMDNREGTLPSLQTNGAVSFDSGAVIELHGTLESGSYALLGSTTGIQGVENLEISGLAGSGLAAQFSQSDGNLILQLYSEDGSDFPISEFVGPVAPGAEENFFISDWLGEIQVIEISDDGSTALIKLPEIGVLWTHQSMVQQSGLWFFSASSRSFLFTEAGTFPYLFRPDLGWVWYAASNPSYRWLYNLDDELWFAETRSQLIQLTPVD